MTVADIFGSREVIRVDYRTIYQQKLITAEAAARLVKDGDWVDYGWSVGSPIDFDKALAARMPELHDVKLRGGVLCAKPAVFDVENAADHFTWNSWHMTGVERKTVSQGFGFYAPLRYSELPRYYRESVDPVNVAVMQVAPMDNHGYFNFGPAASHLAALCEVADIVIVEVNENMPVCLGGFDHCVSVENVDYIIEGENSPLPQLAPSKPSAVDEAIAKLVLEQIPNGACLQLGIGGMPNAIGALIAESDLKDLGVHTELYVDSFVDMTLAGKINGRCKNVDRGRQTYAFGAGTQKLYDFLDNNPECMSAPVDYVNDVNVISKIDNFISINNAIDVDLYGQVNAESSGVRPISGSGGQLDFVLGAYMSRGGKSFICLASTFMNKATGKVESRIRPTLANGTIVTDSRTSGDYLATEYGIVRLKGLTTWQRAEALISVAHPDFREELIAAAQTQGIWRRSNKR